MAKKTAAHKPRNEPGDPNAQPSASEQAEGVVTSSAVDEPASSDHGRRIDTLEKMVHQLAIKVGI